MTWKYLPVLNACLNIIFTVSLGSIMGWLAPQVFDKAFVNASVKFVFHISLPCLVVKGIGVGVDFYSKTFLWKYIACFLILRVFALVLAAISLKLQRKNSKLGIGDVAVRWLALTWISTVILGVPILTAVFGDAQKGAFYGLLAGISSFVFQLPFQLFFFECHKLNSDRLEAEKNDESESPELGQELEYENNDQKEDEQPIIENEGKEKKSSNIIKYNHAIHGKLWRDILIRVGSNPVLWGITLGFIISLSTFGKRYLRPKNDDKTPNSNYLPGLQFFVDSLTWFGECVSPVSLFSMGIWMQMQGRNLVSIGIGEITIFMISKLIIVPILMIGLAKAFQLDDEPGRAAVLIASLPISLASFSLGSKYNKGEAALSTNVAVGTVLMLPTVVIWNLVLDELDLWTMY
mmetsp:Transcript_8511/g.16039  ORF Transcript_8511/g.16039 Transcript_8511/m.16039 type:complete len:405 (-) Transcript_8511:111-1325(-)|eukprot:CAMPEP_0176483548 /NCGR_PEP_ID=MMETSP0200_2-20121128/3979_1 /TAXON_ID=947934 /ORGANISM="Chaetoceros sp., Strain GSL56" /LENGTH=404 /DNA_ID=CAMNT_0017879961 /DNA_START=113 /DNA_END=1327 /DNA_ORIENTATION=+